MKFNKLIPELQVSHFDKSITFYCNVLGFKIEYSRGDKKEDKFAFLSFQDSQIIIQQVNQEWGTGKLEYPFGRGINLQIQVKEIGILLERLKKANYPLFRGLKDNWYRKDDVLMGNREFLVQDPDGYLLRFFEDLGEKIN